MPIRATHRVCLDLTALEMRDRHGGIGRYALSLARNLAAAPADAREGLELYAMAASTGVPVPIARALEERRERGPEVDPRIHDLRRRFQSGARLRASGINLFHSLDAAVLPRRADCPIVATCYDVIPLLGARAAGTSNRARLALRRTRLRRSYRRTAQLIAISALTREDLLRELGIAGERVSLVHLGVDTGRFAPTPEAGERTRLRQELELPERWFLCVGSDHPRKNLERLFAAWLEVSGRLAEGLVIVGKPLYRQTLQRLAAEARERGVSRRFRWLANIDDETLPALYRQATVAVAPSLYEGFGMTLLEAMACGTPVAAARNGAYLEVAGGDALFFDPRDTAAIATALERIAADRELRDSLSRRGLARARRWTWERTAMETLAVYRAVLRRGQGES